jgi:hypothetical protein
MLDRAGAQGNTIVEHIEDLIREAECGDEAKRESM